MNKKGGFEGNEKDVFGLSVSVSGDNVLIGAYADDAGAGDAGSTYLYTASKSVPEPSSLLLLGSGLFGFGLFWRMKQEG